MAKSLMSTWDYECDIGDPSVDQATIECTMTNLLHSIVNGQNAQVQTMRDLLESNGWPEFDNCDRPVEGSAVSVDGVSEYIDMDVSRYDESPTNSSKYYCITHIRCLVLTTDNGSQMALYSQHLRLLPTSWCHDCIR